SEYRDSGIKLKRDAKKQKQVNKVKNLENSTRKRKSRSILIEEPTNPRRSAPEPNQTVSVNLPKIDIPKFYGEITEWQGFWTQFSTAIHENQTLRECDKLVYLRSFLGGCASRSI
ncbi:hypothetical protein B4U79_14894, partial [Dinothrombium tinctorium]